MPFSINAGQRVAFILSLSILLISCATPLVQEREHISPLHLDLEDNRPKSVVIMPFDNETAEAGIEILFRKSFYNHFSSKNYRDIELSEVDRALKLLRSDPSRSWRECPMADLERLLHADYLIFGKVTYFKKIFLGIYSQIAIGVELEMVDGKSGDVVWKRSLLKRSHDGGLPFDPFSASTAAVRSGIHMRGDKTVELVDRVNRELTEQIPEPTIPAPVPFFVEIQVASFLENRRALNTIKEFEGHGFHPRIEIVEVGDRLWHRVVLGPYYNLPEAEEVRDRVTQNSQFRPILIHCYPETEDQKGKERNRWTH